MSLCIPFEVLNQHLVVLGKTGAGKSSALRHVVEELLERKKRVCIVDPKGDWWGLKSSADGKRAGYPIIAFGDFKEPRAADVPINAQSGKHVAELITSGNRPCIIGFRGWMPGQMTDFWIDFASTLFNSSEGELYVVCDEFHNFAPKGKIMDPKAGKVLHWSNRLLSEGRGLGLVFLIASQRPQKVHNDALTCCETLVAMRVNHTADRDAIKAWIDGCGDKSQGQELLANVAQMQRGEAYVWSPEIGFGPQRLKFPMFTTFDSFAPPQLQKKVSQNGWSDVDLDAVKAKLATVIEQHKANDPAELKRKIIELERQMAAKQKANPPAIDETAVTRAVEQAVQQRDRDHQLELNKYVEVIEQLQSGMSSVTRIAAQFTEIELPKQVQRPISVTIPARSPQPARRAPAPSAGKGTHHLQANLPGASSPIKLSPGEKAVLIAAAQYEDGVERDQLSVLTGYKRSSRDQYIQRLSQKGFVDVNASNIYATVLGKEALGSDYEPLPTGQALQDYWLERLPEGERKVLEVLIEAYPAQVLRDAIDEQTGYKRSSRDQYLQRLKSRRLVELVGRGEVKASEKLF